MEDNKSKIPWWEPAAEIFSEVSTWVVVPIVLALIAGKALDKHFQTKPFIFLGLTAVAFFVSCSGIVRVVSRYMKRIEAENQQNINK
ncbi:MAG: AtpZ/AtpI family protein [Candidatus Pacebacteria bacterium]|nr:AtpZ/AtpI family protein [Candidatus Paceibacterota bacterium]